MKIFNNDLSINNNIVDSSNIENIYQFIKNYIENKNLVIEEKTEHNYVEQLQKIKYEIKVKKDKKSTQDLITVWVDLRKKENDIYESIKKQVDEYGY